MFFCYKPVNEGEYHSSCCKRFFGVNGLPKLALNKQLLNDLATKTVNERIAITGVQPKLSLSLEKEKGKDRLTIVGLWGEFILKPQHEHYPSMPEVEDLTMHLAEVFKLPVCKHALIRTTEGNLAYVAKRFDRVNGEKVHVEDFCQLSEFLTENKYKGSYEQAGKIILKYCTNSGIDVLTYFELVVFSFLTGNNDMHLKNFSLLHGEDAIYFAPAYDLLNINLVYPPDKEELALTLNAKKKKINRKDFNALAKSLKILPKVEENAYKKFIEGRKLIVDKVENSFLTNDFKEQFIEIWDKKIQQIS